MLQAMLFDQKDIRILERPVPELGEGDVLVKNRISTTCGTDVKIYMRGYPLLTPPHPFGHEFSGEIVAVGKNVEGFSTGDRVAAHNTAPCNSCCYCKRGVPSMCSDLLFNRGTYAEFVRIPARIVRQNMFRLDDSMSYKTASLLEPFSCAVYGIDNCPMEMGDIVVVNGCGPIGLMFVRLAALKGTRVIAADMKQNRLDTAVRLGAWKAVNLTSVENPVEHIRGLTDAGRGADVVIEATGLVAVWNASVCMARKGGFVLLFGGTKSGDRLEVDATLLHYGQITVKGVFHTTPGSVRKAMELLKMGIISSEDFVQGEYGLADLEKAILSHASGDVIKNCIVYN